MKKLIGIALILIMFMSLSAEDMSVSAYVNKSKIGIQDDLELTVEFKGENAGNVRFTFPKIPNFDGYGTSSSSNSSYSIVNGKMQANVSKSYTIKLTPQKKGNLSIPPFTLKYNNKKYRTNRINIKVVEGSLEAAPKPTVRSSNRRNSDNSENESQKLTDNLFIDIQANKTNVKVGEPFIVEYYLYTRYDVTSLEYKQEPNFEGFWKEELYEPEFRFQAVNYGGVRFNRMLIKRVALFPTDKGDFSIQPMKLKISIRTQSRSFFDFGSSKDYIVSSKPLKVKVSELPPNAPDSFVDAVGQFKISSTISESEMKVGDNFTYTLTISGEGNVSQMDPPILPEINNLRFFEPEISTEMNPSNKKVSGKKIIKYPIIAQEEGEFEIPSIPFSFYDPDQKRYRTLKTNTFKIKVNPGEGVVIHAGTSQKLINLEGKDISHIKENYKLTSTHYLFENVLYWLVWIVAVLTIPISILYAKEKVKLQTNEDYVRQKKAGKILKKYLKQASEFANENKTEFYASAQNGLTNYLCDRLRIPKGSKSDFMLEELKTSSGEEFAVEVEEFFKKSDMIRFMPGGDAQKDIGDDYKKLQELVAKISKKL